MSARSSSVPRVISRAPLDGPGDFGRLIDQQESYQSPWATIRCVCQFSPTSGRAPSSNMGKGGDASVVYRPSSKLSKRVPVEKPDFTVGTLRKAIPPHCFERSLLRSSGYVAADLLGMAALYFCSTFIDQPAVPRWLAYGLLWPTYWFFQGAVGTGVWVIAHECGHQAFSKWQVVNDAVGLTLHSCLLVPYYSW